MTARSTDEIANEAVETAIPVRVTVMALPVWPLVSPKRVIRPRNSIPAHIPEAPTINNGRRPALSIGFIAGSVISMLSRPMAALAMMDCRSMNPTFFSRVGA